VKSGLLVLVFMMCIIPSFAFADEEKSPENKVKDAGYYNHLGISYSKSGKIQEAIEMYKQAIRINPTSPTAYYNIGIVYSKSGKYQEAREMYKQAIKIDPDYTKAHYNLGLIYLLEEDRRSALDECEILKELDKEKANKLFSLINR
jgi:tetratricopeptide (TPR) repeat protein